MGKKALVYIISRIGKAREFEDVAIQLQAHFDLSFVLLNPGPSALEEFLIGNNIVTRRIKFSGKIDYVLAFLKILWLLIRTKPQVVHTHMMDANLIGLTAAFMAGIRRRAYTRHHSSLHHVYFQHGVKFDRLCNFLATDIVSISQTVTDILKFRENVSDAKITYIPHAVEPDDFEIVSAERVNALRKKYHIDEEAFIVGVVSRFTEWKGVQYIIPAFAEFIKTHNKAILLLANAVGDIEGHILNLLEVHLDKLHFRVIRFEPDNFALFKTFNVFVHVPIDHHSEAFGQIYLEALASKTPLICTLSGIANQIIKHQENALVVPYKNSDEITKALYKVFSDRNFAIEMTNNSFETIKPFNLKNKIDLLKRLYEK